MSDRYYLPICILLVLLSGCKKKHPDEETGLLQHKEESFEGVQGYVLKEKGFIILDLENNKKIKEISRSQDYYKIKTNFVTFPQKIVDLSTNKEIITLQNIKDFIVGKEWLFVLTDEYVSVYSKDNLTLQKNIPISSPLCFALSPYEIRMYIVTTNSIDIYETREFSYITSIPIVSKISSAGICITPAGNKIYCFGDKKVYIIAKTTNKIEGTLSVNEKIKLVRLSRDGSFGIILSQTKTCFFDAGTDKIIAELPVAGLDVTTSPGDSRIYLLDNQGLLIITTGDFSILQRIRIENGKEIFVKKVQGHKRTIDVSIGVSATSPDTFFTIQASSGRSLPEAKTLVELLRQAHYPAFAIQADEWVRVRIGLFETRGDAKDFSRKVATFLGKKVWVDRTVIDKNIVPSPEVLGLNDIDRDGFPEDACQIESKRIVVFKIKNRVYKKVYETRQEQETYTGDPEFRDFDGDGNIELVTPTTKEGIYSIISYKKGCFTEEFVEWNLMR